MLDYIFLRYALLGIVLASVACGIVGTYVVVRRLVFISGGIAHASLGGVGIALYAGVPPLIMTLLVSVLSALGIRKITGREGGDANEREDSVIAVFWTLGMAVGILFGFLTKGYGSDLSGYLFGNLLMITPADLWLLGGVAALTVAGVVCYHRQLTACAFDPDFARTAGLPVVVIEYVMMVLIAVTIVAVLRIVGIVLAIALLTIPQMTAGLFARNMRQMMWWSSLLCLGIGLLGLTASYLLDVPSGATLVICACGVYFIGRLFKGRGVSTRQSA
jgi:zinc transport system permease protein